MSRLEVFEADLTWMATGFETETEMSLHAI